jgi:hypothetical protein
MNNTSTKHFFFKKRQMCLLDIPVIDIPYIWFDLKFILQRCFHKIYTCFINQNQLIESEALPVGNTYTYTRTCFKGKY